MGYFIFCHITLYSAILKLITFLGTFAILILRWFEVGGTYEVQKHTKKHQQRALLMPKQKKKAFAMNALVIICDAF